MMCRMMIGCVGGGTHPRDPEDGDGVGCEDAVHVIVR